MRVIAGEAKGRRLASVPGDGTRPITDRAKEALFSIIGDWIVGTRVLDLFGGTGSVGIEALSRGADYAQFVDKDRRACETILANLKSCQLGDRGRVQRADSFKILDSYRGDPFDFIYIAPPQYREFWRTALEKVDSRPELLAQYGAVVVQIHPREFGPVALAHLEEYDRRKYGSVLLIFFAASEDLINEPDEELGEEPDEELV